MRLHTHEELAHAVGQVESALRGIIALGAAVQEYNPDSPAYQFACLVTPLADTLARVYCVLLDRSTQEREQTEA